MMSSTVDGIKPTHYLKDPHFWELWIPYMGNAGFISSTVVWVILTQPSI